MPAPLSDDEINALLGVCEYATPYDYNAVPVFSSAHGWEAADPICVRTMLDYIAQCDIFDKIGFTHLFVYLSRQSNGIISRTARYLTPQQTAALLIGLGTHRAIAVLKSLVVQGSLREYVKRKFCNILVCRFGSILLDREIEHNVQSLISAILPHMEKNFADELMCILPDYGVDIVDCDMGYKQQSHEYKCAGVLNLELYCSEIPLEKLSLIDATSSRVASKLAARLSAIVEAEVDVKALPAKSIQLYKMIATYPVPSFVDIYAIADSDLYGFLQMDPSIIYPLALQYYGCEGDLVELIPEVINDEFSWKFFDVFAEAIEELLSEDFIQGMSRVSVETYPQFLRMRSPTEVVTECSFIVSCKDYSGCIGFMLPQPALAKVKSLSV